MHKIDVVGDKDTILPFKALGLCVYPVIDEMAKNNFGIIFVTEQTAILVKETIERYTDKIVPAIIVIPNNQGTLGLGLNKIDEYVEKAIGSNIF